MSLRGILLLSCLIVVAVVPVHAETPFDIQIVDPSGDPGRGASLALDSFGWSHISYIDAASRDLRYATNEGGMWHIEFVEDYSDLRVGTTIVVDHSGEPAITHTGAYLTKSDSGWVWEPMGGFSPWTGTVALDAQDNAYGVTIWSWGSGIYHGFVSYCVRGATAWDYEDIAGAPFIPSSPTASIVMDANGDPHISVTPSSGEPLQYFHKSGLGWSSHAFAPGQWSSIVLDAAGEPRISFYDIVEGNLVLATHSDGSWSTATLDTAGNVGMYTSQAIVGDVSHISYYDCTNHDLKYAIFSPQGVIVQTVDSEGDVGSWTSLALDEWGRPHIAYHDATNGDLKYAVAVTPVSTEVKTLGGVKSLYRR